MYSATRSSTPAFGTATRATLPRARRAGVRDRERVCSVDRRPLVGRPGGAPLRYERVRLTPPRRPAPRPQRRVEQAQLGFATLAAAALLTALIVAGFLVLAQWRAVAPQPAQQPAPAVVEQPSAVSEPWWR
ncbi:hypothetical protein CJ469_02043 [Nocardia farcinica]|uniref:hypothetical protein n=1 Tax=Nocardia farcinica TaxID=37329 RepID=UPI000BF27A12|nr:hypothetical protein [Nocardia farcinica]MBF6139634.1 hypothetical protein [Nocardia farcinica]PFX04165.1 hypothetical protein CJ469_02043 [Nocardia farcinica]PFX10323.1 hypothetical protein CJ468_01174 [Nocardia farcinica]